MAHFSSFRLTQNGINFFKGAIESKLGLNSNTYSISSVKVGTGYTTNENPAALYYQKKSLPISNLTSDSSNVYIRALLDNAGNASSWKFSEIGVFGRVGGGTERLLYYAYQQNNTLCEYIPPASQQLIEKTLDITIAIGAAASVTFEMTPEAPAASIGCARMDAHNEGEFSCDGVSVGDAYFHEDEVYASVIVTNDISGINGPIYCETGMVGSGAFVKASGTFTVSSDVAANGTIFVQNGYLSNAFQCRLEAAGPSNAIRMNLEPGNVFCGMIMNYDTTGCFVGNCFAKGQGAQVLQTAVALTTGRIYKFIIF